MVDNNFLIGKISSKFKIKQRVDCRIFLLMN